MALFCRHGGECSGCGSCRPDGQYTCPVCGRELDEIDRVYSVDEIIIGCEYCVRSSRAEDILKGE